MRPYEENHFLRGDRVLQLRDVRLARYFGPVLVLIAQGQKTKTFRQFLNIAKRNFPNSKLVQDAIPVNVGRRFEAFRLYLRCYDLPDPSAWITNRNAENSAAYVNDFDPDLQRTASASFDWSPYVPRQKSLWGVKSYSEFFRSLEYFARSINPDRSGPALQEHLAKVHIRGTIENYSQGLSKEQRAELVKLEKKDNRVWIERVKSGERFHVMLREILND